MANGKKYPHLKELFYSNKNEYFKAWKKLNADKFPVKDKWRILKHYKQLPDDVREIPGYPSYYARPNGEIWRDTINNPVNVVPGKGKIIKLKDRYNPICNYHQVQPYVDGKRKVCYVHRLVLLAFEGEPIGDRNEAHHMDANTSNNHIDNLKWVTRLENAQYVPTEKRRVSKKTLATGRKPHQSRWRNVYPEIKRLHEGGMKLSAVAEKLGVPKGSIYALYKLYCK